MVNVVGQSKVVVRETLCRHCGAVLEYTPRDVKTGTDRDYTGCVDAYKYIECPTCMSEVVLKHTS